MSARVLLDTGRLEFEQNLRSKVFGLMVLDRLLADRTLDFGIVVSSLSAVLGGLGHMAYAAANATADAYVLKRNQMGRGLWTSVDWDSWKFEQGRIDQVQAILNMLDYSMDEAEGTRAIDLLFALPQPEQVVISTGNLALRVKLWIAQHAVIRSAEAKGGQHKRPDVETPFAEPQGPIEQRLALIWMEALGLDRVGRRRRLLRDRRPLAAGRADPVEDPGCVRGRLPARPGRGSRRACPVPPQSWRRCSTARTTELSVRLEAAE